MRLEIDRRWRRFFSDPTMWWDNRSRKRHWRCPDFRHAVSGEGLWIGNVGECAEWVASQAKRLEDCGGQGRARYREGNDVETCQATLAEYERRRMEGIGLGVYSVVEALKQCGRLGDIQAGRRIHEHVVERGECWKVILVNTLMDMYAKCGSLEEARDLFERMQGRDAVSWNCIINGYAQNGEAREALIMFARMEQEGFYSTRVSILAALKACSTLAEEKEAFVLEGEASECELVSMGNAVKREGVRDGKAVRGESLQFGSAVHAQAVRAGLQTDVAVATSLVHMYGNCGSLVAARRAFESVERPNVVLWNAIIMVYAENHEHLAAMEMYESMKRHGFVSTHVTILVALKACSSLVGVRKLYEDALEIGNGDELDHRVANALVDAYSRCGSTAEACKLFESMPMWSVVSWNSIISGLAAAGEGQAALDYYKRMVGEGFGPNAITFVAALKACMALADNEAAEVVEGKLMKRECLGWGRNIHRRAVSFGYELNLFVAHTLLSMYAKCGSMQEARQLFDRMEHRNSVSWNCIISGYADHWEGKVALELYARMQQEGFAPNRVTILAALKACISLAETAEGRQLGLKRAKAIHEQAVDRDYDMKAYVGATLVDTYAKCGSIEDAHSVFESIPNKDVVAWSAMVMGYAQAGKGKLALEMFARMKDESCQPNAVTYVAAIKACSVVANLEKGKHIHEEACSAGLEGDVVLANTLVDFYGKCGSMGEAEQVFEALGCKRTVVAWGALVTGYANLGNAVQCLQLLDRMQRERTRPNDVVFLAVLSACNHAGMIDEAKRCLELMSWEHGLVPSVEHYNCIVDVLGRANRLEEALNIVRSMPVMPNEITWNTLLSSCQKWNNKMLGKLAFESLMEIRQSHGAGYVLMSNACAQVA